MPPRTNHTAHPAAGSALIRACFAPVTWLIERVRFARSLLLLLLLIPDVYVALLLYQQTSKDVDFSDKERQGVAYIAPAHGLLALIERHRLLGLADDAAARSEQLHTSGSIEAAMIGGDQVEARYGANLDTGETWKQVRAQWTALRGVTEPTERDAAYARLGSLLTTELILNKAGNNSNLILDPDLDSYWMMDAFVVKLPVLSELATAAGAGATRALSDGMVSTEERIDLAGLCRLIDATTDDLINIDLKSALEDNEKRGDRSLRAAVESEFTATATRLRAFTARLREGILSGRAPGAVSPAREAIAAVESVRDLHAVVGPELDRLCRVRADGVRQTRLLGIVAAIVAASLISYVFNGFVRSVGAAQARVETENRKLQADILGLLEVVSSAADGDLTARARVGEGTLGNVADAFNQMMESWQELMGAINGQLVRSNQAVAQLRDAAARMARGATQQAAEVAQATGSVQRMSEQIDRVSGNAEDAAAAAKRTQQSAQEGSNSVQEVVKGMDALRALVQAGAKKVKTLGDRSMEITSIVGTIAKISEQTNMLALNAAIEAARAGEQGRGFSVVADEVRKLAERAAGATKEVDRLVRTIQSETGESVLAIERQTQVVEEEGRAVALAGGALDRIRDVSSRSSNLAADIAAVSRAQAGDAHAVAAMMQRISTIARDTESGAQGSLAIAQGLGELSEELRASIGRFKVD